VGRQATDGEEVVRGRQEALKAQKGTMMPKVGGKKFPYTTAGKKAAKQAKMSASKPKGKKRGK